jgi:membrane-bound lytic murein transglycosylase MltF
MDSDRFLSRLVLACATVCLLPSKAQLFGAPQHPSPARPAVAAPSTELSAWTGDLDGMLKRRQIRVAVAYSKTQYYVVQGQQTGVSYEILKAFEAYLNRRYPHQQKHLGVHVVFRPTPRDKLLSRLTDGTADLAVAGLTVTPERQKLVDFSNPTFSPVNEIAVTGPRSPALHTLGDLSGQEVYLRPSSSYWEHVERLNERFRQEKKPPVKLRAVPEDLEDEDLLEMINAGLLPTTIVDDYFAALWSKVLTHLKSHPEIAVNSGGEFAWALRKDSPKLMAVVNDFVKTHRQGTLFGNVLIRRYLLSTEMVRNAISPAGMKRFEQTAQIFQTYSPRYGMDYLLMMAQGYQESGLNQEAKSRAGAIGIMQLMPTTGAQMKVGDIHKEDANIHAGVKYIRFMVDQYFANEPMDDLDKVLFAFAAYNCGPSRVRQLRKAAADQGLDPNVWTDNVEMVAAARIGLETVTYVSNIYKYYIAYKLISEGDEGRRRAREVLQKRPS